MKQNENEDVKNITMNEVEEIRKEYNDFQNNLKETDDHLGAFDYLESIAGKIYRLLCVDGMNGRKKMNYDTLSEERKKLALLCECVEFSMKWMASGNVKEYVNIQNHENAGDDEYESYSVQGDYSFVGDWNTDNVIMRSIVDKMDDVRDIDEYVEDTTGFGDVEVIKDEYFDEREIRLFTFTWSGISGSAVRMPDLDDYGNKGTLCAIVDGNGDFYLQSWEIKGYPKNIKECRYFKWVKLCY